VTRPRTRTTRAAGGGAKGPKAPPRGAATEDRGFGRTLATKSVGRIVPEAMNRLEAGRRQYVRLGLSNVEAELELLRQERKRLEGEEDAAAAAPRLARVTALAAAAEIDLAARQAVLAAIERAEPARPGGWNVLGRVLQRSGAPPPKATVVFVAERGQVVGELGVLPVGDDGLVRKAYEAEVVAPLVKKGVAVSASVRIGSRVLATEEAPSPIAADGVHQFDLIVDL